MAKNRFGTMDQSRFSVVTNILLPVLSVIFCLVFLLGVVGQISDTTEAQQQKSIEKAVSQGAVHCYATEGSYPENIQYLKDHYGLQYDEEKYLVDYRVFASNIVPDILVIKLK